MTDEARAAIHIPVLRDEVVDALGATVSGLFLDCTFGGGGHSRAILDGHADNRVVGLDRDLRAITRGKMWQHEYGDRLELIHGSFSQIEELVSSRVFDGVLADLGMSTDQLYEERGFSFSDQGAFDMRMNETDGITAAEFVNGASERELYLALVKGGVGKNGKQIAQAIQRARPIATAKELGEVIRQSQLGKRGESRSHPATVVFQAIRIHINREREEIEDLLEAAPHIVKSGRRLAIITFHSLEDRIVTSQLREWESAGTFPASWRGPREGRQLGRLTTRKPILPSDAEIDRNPASRSARLRVFEFM